MNLQKWYQESGVSENVEYQPNWSEGGEEGWVISCDEMLTSQIHAAWHWYLHGGRNFYLHGICVGLIYVQYAFCSISGRCSNLNFSTNMYKCGPVDFDSFATPTLHQPPTPWNWQHSTPQLYKVRYDWFRSLYRIAAPLLSTLCQGQYYPLLRFI